MSIILISAYRYIRHIESVFYFLFSPQMGFNSRLASPIHTQLLTNRLAAASAGFPPGSFTGMPAPPGPVHHQMARPPGQFHPTHQQNSKHIPQHPNQSSLGRLPDGINKVIRIYSNVVCWVTSSDMSKGGRWMSYIRGSGLAGRLG